MIEFVGPMTRS